MAKQSLVILAVLALLVCCATWASAQVIKTDRPIIGIITHPETEASSAYPHRQYIAASYVKWIESSGGRVVPIPHNIDLAEGKKLLRQLNGLMLVGGAFIYNDHVGALIDEAVQMNREGIYFPIHGTCLGFEWLGIYFSQNKDLLTPFSASDVPMHLDFAKTANQTTWYNYLPDSLRSIFADRTAKVTMNNHVWGISLENFNKFLINDFHLISTNVDPQGRTFVSTMQHKKYPIVGLQWHPEKNNFEFGVDADGTPHSTSMHTMESVIIAQYCSNYFVHECRQSPNSFADWKEAQARLTYNYPKFRGNTGSFVEKYWFDTWF